VISILFSRYAAEIEAEALFDITTPAARDTLPRTAIRALRQDAAAQ